MDAEKATEGNPDGYSFALLCRVLKFPRATYYSWLVSRPAVAKRQRAENELVEEIREIHGTSRGAYGAPRVHAALRRKGHAINRKKIERIMRERDIRGMTRRKRQYLTKQDTKAAPAPDLVGRDFTAAEPGTKLVGDITYLATIEGWWYLATVIDLATREVIGYAMADHHRAELVTDALKMAAGRGQSARLHHAHRPRQRVHE
ncbi:IS3 family transposase [Streptomyces sp. NPDC052051]|uniref:IS3 family transposase n=1 Tax=Streptomyces sp. NPDC052051 TaxID=3154649 RepID=UPI00342B1D6E